MAEFLKDWKRTHYCTDPTVADIGQEVTIMGWAAKRRDLGALIFIDLRDRSGIMQVVFDAGTTDANVFSRAETIRSEYVIAVKGVVVKRDEETINTKLPTGEIEVRVSELKILSKSETPPFAIDDDVNVQELLRLKYRYLDLRRSEMQKNLFLRHRVAKLARDYYDRNGFIEVETPILIRSSPEGARDYLVPSRVHPGEFYALPQSPQLFKQMLMLSGFDRYIQIAKCFRDEDLRADRQPEFTQIDLEMSFVDEDDVMAINEGFVSYVFKETLGVDIPLPLKRLPYKEAMDRFGSDKPDTRFGLELIDISDIAAGIDFNVFSGAVKNGGSVRVINAKDTVDKLARREIDALVDFVKQYRAKGMAWISITPDGLKSAITKFMTQEQVNAIITRCGGEVNDTLFFVADANDDIVYNALGALRLELARKFDLIDNSKADLLWVTDFPLFEYSEEDKRYIAKHHPFTSPKDEDIDLLETNPGAVRAKAYDIVFNGNEIGGGSIRIYDAELQERMFKMLGFTKEEAYERFGFLMNAFRFGPPPHGGLAFGLDRFVMLLTNSTSIRDVIAFPKIQNASCPMTDAPCRVEDKQLEELCIKVDLPAE